MALSDSNPPSEHLLGCVPSGLRPVWITQQQRDDLARIYVLKPPAVVGPIIEAWDYAPHDAVAQLAQVLLDTYGGDYRATLKIAEAQARALGAPWLP